MITQLRLKELLSYDKASGNFTWIWPISWARNGSIAGFNRNGYVVIYIDGRQHKAHRLVFLYLYGSLPPDQVDHINHNRADNRIVNLRRCDNSTNMKNVPLSRANTSGIVGVYWFSQTQKWQAQIQVDSKKKHLGYFERIEDAATARKTAELKYGFHRNHGCESPVAQLGRGD